MSDILSSMWVEKYRPATLKDVSLPERYSQDFERIITKNMLPNLLFSGPPGGGKTTLALILCSKNGVLQNKSDNLLMANGSSKKERSINFVDQVVEPFLKHPPAGGDRYKIVFMDEADNITGDAYDSWRGIIEKYHKAYGRFIWTCNYVSKIPDPVQSRFTPYIFQQIPKDFVHDYCEIVLKTEKVEYDKKDITFIINQLYPDVRRIINILQRSSWNGKLIVDKDSVITNERVLISYIVEIISCITKGEDNKIGPIINKVIDVLSAQDLEYRNVYTELFFMNKIPAPAKIIINKYSNSHQGCLIPHMHFMAMVFDIFKSLQAYKKAMTSK